MLQWTPSIMIYCVQGFFVVEGIYCGGTGIYEGIFGSRVILMIFLDTSLYQKFSLMSFSRNDFNDRRGWN